MPFGRVRVNPARASRLAGLGALAVAGGAALLFALFVYGTRATASGGMDMTSRAIAWISVGGVVLLIVVVHLVYARDLMRRANRLGASEAGGRGG